MPYTDAYGIWQELSPTYVTVTDDWLTLPNDCTHARLFRFSFDVPWTEWNEGNGYRSFAYWRFAHHDDSGNFGWCERAIRLYPKVETLFIELPLLTDLVDNLWAIRKGEIKRVKQIKPFPKKALETYQINFDATGDNIPTLDWKIFVDYLVA